MITLNMFIYLFDKAKLLNAILVRMYNFHYSFKSTCVFINLI